MEDPTPVPAPIIVLPSVSSASESEHRKLGLKIPERKGCKFGWKLIGELKAVAESLGPEVPIARPDDGISGFGRVRAEVECMGMANDEKTTPCGF